MTATKQKRAAATQRVQMLPIDRLVPAADNGRRPVSANSLKSLARSIRKNGVLQPILVRAHPTESETWEIRAGYRRWRAAQIAGLEKIPAIVRSLDDEAALTVTITENLQRENLHPLEEAAVIQQAFERGYDIEAVAGQLGKNPQFVARRASLTRLAPVWRKAVLRPDSPAHRLSPAHLELIARLPEETQVAMAQDEFYSVFGRGFPSVADLARIIDGGLHTLAAMPWSVNDETLDPKVGACCNCPKRSSAQPLLFDAEDAPSNGKPSKTDRCLDPACFDRKQVAHVQRCEAELRVAHPSLTLVQIGGGSMSSAAHEAFGDRVQRLYAPAFVKAGDPNAVPSMQVDGPKAGKLVYIDGGGRENGSGRTRRGRRPKEERKPATLEERQARHHKRRQAFVVKQIETRLRELTIEDVSRMLAAQQQGAQQADGNSPDAVSLLLSFGTSGRADGLYHEDPWDRYDRLRAGSTDERLAAAVYDVTRIWVRRLTMHDSRRVEFQAIEARRVCELLGIDFAAVEAEAVRVLPQPKSWGLPPEHLPQPSQPADACSESEPDRTDDAPPKTQAESETHGPRGRATPRRSRSRRHDRTAKRRRKGGTRTKVA